MYFNFLEKINEIVNLSSETIKLRTFEEKQIWFKFQVETLRIPWNQGSDPIMITKENIINDTLNFIDLCDMHKVFVFIIHFYYIEFINFLRKLKSILKMIKLMMLEVFFGNGFFYCLKSYLNQKMV